MNEGIEKELERVYLECRVHKDGSGKFRRFIHGETFAHIIWNIYNPDNQKVKGDGYLIHHKDENPLSDNIENLQKMTRSEHQTLHMSDESRRKNMSLAVTGNTNNLGKKFSEKSKRKMSLSRMGNKNSLGYKHSEETKKKIGEASKGRNPNLGKTFSEEYRKKISNSKTGEKNPMYGKGYLTSGEKNGMFGKKHSEETKRKMSISAKRRHLIKKEKLNEKI